MTTMYAGGSATFNEATGKRTTPLLQSQRIDGDIAKFNDLLKTARDKWDDGWTRLGSFLGGVDPKAVLGALNAVEERAKRWKARGAALAAGKPLDIDDGERVKLDTPALWIEMGNVLIREVEHAAELAATAGLDDAITYTAQETAGTIGQGVVDLAQTANDVGSSLFSWRKPLLWIGLLTVGLVLLVNVGGIAFLVKLKQGAKALIK